MKLHQCVQAAVIGVGFTLLISSEATATYTFTKIADNTGSFFGSFDSPPPSINNQGTVAFRAELRESKIGIFRKNGIYTGDGGRLTTIATTDDNSLNLFGTSINDSGTVAFTSVLRRLEQNSIFLGLFTGNGGKLTTITDSSGPFNAVTFPVINNKDTVVFAGTLKSGGSDIFTSREEIANLTNSGNFGFRAIGVNNSETVAFQALERGGRESIFTSSNDTVTTIATTNPERSRDPFRNLDGVSINDSDTVAFVATLPGGKDQLLFISSDGTLTKVAEASLDGDKPFVSLGRTAINDRGVVAFVGRPVGALDGIFTGPDPVKDKVIAFGDSLFGSTVSGISLGVGGLNDAGQIAFSVQLRDGTQAVVRADPQTAVEALVGARTLCLSRI